MQVATHKKWNEEHPTISIIPTALYVGWKNGPYTSQANNGIYVVPYSDHSSYPELMDMVSSLAPHQILPIVKYWSKSGWWSDPTAPDQDKKADMTVYRHLLSLPPPDPVIIPESVIKLMERDAPRLFRMQPRKYILRKGLSPRSSRIRGVTHSTPGSQTPHSFSYASAATPTSFTTLGSSMSSINKDRPKKQHEKQIQSARRKLILPSKGSVASREKETDSTTKMRLERVISERRDALMKETADFAACKSKKLNAPSTSKNTKGELEAMLHDSKLLLESLSCLDFLL